MELREFLVRAKVATYASGGESSETKLSDGSSEFAYAIDGFRYRDRYFGFSPFAGEEVVWKNEVVLWSMNYYGRIMFSDVDARVVYGFLREALKRVDEGMPFRGPGVYMDKDFEYSVEVDGNMSAFSGIEKIFKKGRLVYILYFHGGLVCDGID